MAQWSNAQVNHMLDPGDKMFDSRNITIYVYYVKNQAILLEYQQYTTYGSCLLRTLST